MSFSDVPYLEHFLPLQHNFRFSLHEVESVWLLEKGVLDVFAIEKINGKASGKRLFVHTIDNTGFLFGFQPSSEIEIIAVAEAGSSIKKIEKSLLCQVLNDLPGLHFPFLKELAAWIERLYTPLLPRKEVQESSYLPVESQDTYQLNKGNKFSLPHPHTLFWFQIAKGKIGLREWEEIQLTEGQYFPLIPKIWWQTLSQTLLRKIPSSELIKNHFWNVCLTNFHILFVRGIIQEKHEEAKREKKLIKERLKLEESALGDSFAALAQVLNRTNLPTKQHLDPLFLACQLVAQTLNIQLEMPNEGLKEEKIASQIHQMADRSNVRYRRISLKGKWYKEDNGPLVAFYGEDKKPVALLSTDRGRYRMIDPLTQKEEKVDRMLANQIDPTAFEFHASFPNTVASRWQALKFAFFDKGKKVWLVFLMGAALSLLNLILPIGSKIIFGTAIPQLDRILLWEIGGALFAAAISSAIYQFCQGFLIFRINSLSGNRFETAIWDRILKLPARFFRKFSTGDLYARISGYVTLRRTFNNYYMLLMLNAVFSIFYFIAMCFFSFPLAVVTLLATAISLGTFYLCLVRMVNLQNISYTTKGNMNGFILQVISGITKVRATGSEKYAFAKWAKYYAQAKKTDLKSQYYSNATDSLFAAMPMVSTLLIFSMVIYYIVQATHTPHGEDTLSKGNFFGFITAFTIFNSAIFSSIPAFTYVYRVLRPIWVRGAVILDTEPETAKQPKKSAEELKGAVLVDKIYFRYQEKGPYILENVTLRAEPGEFIGIVGPSGSGKTTLVRLLLGFESPEKGTILYDGNDLAHLDERSVRKQLGVVLQNGSILAGTIYENLVGGGVYSQEEVERAIHLSAFDQDLTYFPMGLHTVLPSGGGTLSGGQRQRLLIARALISNPKILIFDEAASALDNRTQKELSRNIAELRVTRIVIAHRMSTLQQSDRIYVLDEGKIVEEGTFEALASRSGLFSELISRQKI